METLFPGQNPTSGSVPVQAKVLFDPQLCKGSSEPAQVNRFGFISQPEAPVNRTVNLWPVYRKVLMDPVRTQ